MRGGMGEISVEGLGDSATNKNIIKTNLNKLSNGRTNWGGMTLDGRLRHDTCKFRVLSE